MTVLYRTRITEIGPEVAELAEGGVLILFADGSPPELAEVAVLHKVEDGPSEQIPAVGDLISIGAQQAVVTSVGSKAWANVRDLGHVVISFTGGEAADRPGEICASEINMEALVESLVKDTIITIEN